MMLVGLLWMVLLIGLPVYLLYWLTTRSRPAEPPADSSLAVLREQYACGDIDEEEFERRRARLDTNR